jgi:hypothetical protein
MSEFILTQSIDENGKKSFVGGGYKINLFENSPLTTLNYLDINENTDTNTNANENVDTISKHVSNLFDNLAIPSGLYFMHNLSKEKCEFKTEKHEVLNDDIFDKLFNLVEYDKKQKRKTKKYKQNKQNKTKKIIQKKI